MNLLVRYITQGRVEGDRPPMSPRWLTSLVLTHPDHLTDTQREQRHELTTACRKWSISPVSSARSPPCYDHTRATAHDSTRGSLPVWAADLPHLHTFARGLDCEAVPAAITMPYHNGGTEGVNTKTKRIMRQMHGRAGFTLLRHRILLNWRHL
jgi:transposase